MSDRKIYLCRCEDITREDLHDLLVDRNLSMEEIKRITRCTMGPCQGQTCRELIVKEIAKIKNIDITEVDQPTFRAPIKPVKLGKIGRCDRDA